MNNVQEFARRLDEAASTSQAIDQIDPEGRLSLDEAYAIQRALLDARLKRGEHHVGVKMGFTSRAKMIQMGISDVIWGRLSDRMQVEEGGAVSITNFIRPRVEPELAFVLKAAMTGQESAVAALAAVEAIAPAIEIIDSRYREFKFGLTDVIADNASASGFVVGAWHSPRRDFSNLGLAMSLDGRVRQTGSTAAILGHPLRSLVAAARLSAAAGEPLQAGWIVMAGGVTTAEWANVGQHISIEMDGLGITEFEVVA